MESDEGLASLIGPPLIVGLSVLLVNILPREVIDVLSVWTLLSLPVGMLIGHCSLND